MSRFQQYFFSLFVFLTLFFFSSCSKKTPDTDAPTLELMTPQSDLSLKNGESFNFQANFTDDTNLFDFNIQVKPLFSNYNTKVPFLVKDWDTLITKHIAGTHTFADIIINVPEDAKVGGYRFTSWCTDIHEKESAQYEFDFDVQNVNDMSLPSINLIAPFPVDGVVRVLSMDIPYIAILEDNRGLGEALIKLYRIDANNESVLFYRTPARNLAGKQSDTLQITIARPSEKGSYHSEFIVTDLYNNQTVIEFDLLVN